MSKPKIALITGGSSGLGYATAKKFIEEGYHTIITGRNADKLDHAAKQLGDLCTGIVFDMEWLDKMPEFVQDLQARFQRIDVLVNNAGINHKQEFIEVTNEDFERVIKINQTALFALSREVTKVMINQTNGGVIIHIGSMAGHYGIPKVIAYTAAKTALEGMTKAMAVELSPLGIRVNCVAPGFIKTPMSAKALDNDPERKNKVLSRTPMRKLGVPEDIANAVFFLASDQASFISGETLKVDGGNSIGF